MTPITAPRSGHSAVRAVNSRTVTRWIYHQRGGSSRAETRTGHKNCGSPSIVGSVTLSAGTPASGARYDWQVGAQVLDDVGASPQVTLAAGRHSVVVTVSSGAQIATCSAVQIVHRPLLPVANMV